MRVLLLSTYDLGRQPFGLASPAAWLKRAGFDVTSVDLSRGALEDADALGVSLAAFFLPMHTATRLAVPVIDRLRATRPEMILCAYGLYAPLNESLLCDRGVDVVLGPEAESDLVALAGEIAAGGAGRAGRTGEGIPRLPFIAPDRSGLPPLSRYASLQMPDGARKTVGATDATRGCKHRCRHCPIVPVYDGQFRVVPVEVVLADIRALVAAGAEHITFGDPDFFNGPAHARRIVEALHAEFPALSYDVTVKVEHLRAHRELLPILASTGCAFVTSAVESIDDRVLALLEKGHTRADFIEVAELCREAGLMLAPTFVAFTPWTSIEGYAELLDLVEELGLAGHVAPVQWAIRLLVTWQSRLLELPDIRQLVGPFDSRSLTYPWRHPDAHVDELQRQVMDVVAAGASRPRLETFARVRQLADSGRFPPLPSSLRRPVMVSRSAIPYLNEPWYC